MNPDPLKSSGMKIPTDNLDRLILLCKVFVAVEWVVVVGLVIALIYYA